MINKTNLISLVLVLSACACLHHTEAQTATLQSEQKRFLLLDSRIVESSYNAKLEVGKVEKHAANPLFVEENDWEMRFDNLYGNVIYDEVEKSYKCWYSPFIVDSSSHGMTLKQRNRKYKPPKNREMGICYATSKNGIKWDKPNLGLVEYNDSKQNNIVWRGPHGAGIFKDLHEKDPNKRFKMISQGLVVSYSTDGIHWVDKVKVKGVSVAGDTHNNALWAPSLNKYVGITRAWIKKEGHKKREREVARIESDDFENWTKEEVVLQGEEYDLQPYAMPTFYYAGVYLGLVAIHEQSSDKVWTELAWSPDTKKWFRINAGNPLIPTSEKELDYDYGCVYACAYPVIKKNHIQLYYGGSDWLHNGWRNGSLCLATLRPDGFAGYTSATVNKPTTITTTPIKFNGESIKITADIKKGGNIKVTVLNEIGEEVADAKPISKTGTDKIIRLNRKVRLQKIKLKFEFESAKLYSFSFGK